MKEENEPNTGPNTAPILFAVTKVAKTTLLSFSGTISAIIAELAGLYIAPLIPIPI